MILDHLDPLLPVYIRAAADRKVKDLVVLDVRKLTSVADVFLICSGSSNRQVTAIAEYIRSDLKDRGIKPISIEGLGEGHWVVLDYGHIIIHVFYDPIRVFYDLDGLWSDAERIAVAETAGETPAQVAGKTGKGADS